MIDQTVNVDGNENTTVVAGRDAHVVVNQPSAQARAELVKYLAPFLLPVLLLLTFGQQLGLPGRIAVAVATAAWMAWSAARDTYLRLIQRIALPVIAVAYTTSLTISTAIPDIPAPLQIAVPAILWVAAAGITLRLIESEHRSDAAQQYMGIAVIGLGIASINFGGAALRGEALLGVVGVGVGVGVIGIGVAMISGSETLFGVAMIGVGLAGIGLGVAGMLRGFTLFGVSMIGGGVAVIGFGVAMIGGGDTLFGVAAIGIGVAMIGGGVEGILGGDILLGVSLIGIGVSLIGAGVAGFLRRLALFGVAVIGGGVSLIGVGVEGILLVSTLFGVAVIGGGVAVIGVGAALITEARSS
ncbi:hypothetical protein ACFYT3_31780 [Nocardia amikacinitolerans]|uniref:hypothetical protein n=1 Tax=Nocardia amikacinitolerans TaxID=756689 RepID=UPI0036BDC7DC